MNRKLKVSIIGGILGFVVGAFGGGFLGLVLGGTFLGGLDIYKQTGIEGYVLTAFIGAIFGAIADTPLGVSLALIIDKRIQNKR